MNTPSKIASSKINVALFASGTGTNALQLLTQSLKLSRVRIPLVIVDREDSPLPEKVRALHPSVVVKVIPSKKTKLEHETEILNVLREFSVDWIFLAGYMRILGPTLLNAFQNRVVNIHPSLLPQFPGKDGYRDAFEAKVAQSGITVHLVDAGIDTGKILLQERFAREANDTYDSFFDRGRKVEWTIYPKILQMLDQEGTLMPKAPALQNQTFFAIPTHGESRFSVFWIKYSGEAIAVQEFQKVAPVLVDEVDQKLWVNPSQEQWQSQSFTELQIIHFKPGVTDNPAKSFHDLLAFHPLFKGKNLQVHSGEAVLLKNNNQAGFNPLIQQSISFPFPGPQENKLNQLSFQEPNPPLAPVEKIKLHSLSGEELKSLSQKRFWALSEEEMLIIQKHFGEKPVTDVEIEVIAQTWSEHCKHKIFAATIDYEDAAGVGAQEKFQVQSLFKTYIEKPTTELQKKKDWAISVFKDNAGIVRFHDDVDLCIKVETHNSPSALDPYGGALTGILGVNRDILGTGLGARPIANTNVLCFGEPKETEPLPKGLLHPLEIFTGVHRGIQDGGNKSGIPTVNGAIIFDECFSGKPLVFCGTVGVLPRFIESNNKKIASASKNQVPGDLIVMVGGAVGMDGLHGATSSSLALDNTTPSSMVQIGDPLTQKRVLDFLLEARDAYLYSSVTDNGAGGLSSSIGEMAEATNGAKVYLDQVPLKYPGLAPWQILVSESQERMTFSVPKEKIEKLKALAQARGVDATVVGEFTNSGFLEAFYHQELTAKLSLEFLHHGLPKMKLKAKWNGPQARTTWKAKPRVRTALPSVSDILHTLVSDPSIASKEKWVRGYDHEVQAATAMKPFEGITHTAPNDSGVVWMGAHGNRGFEGAAVASGICPDFALMDGALMATLAADEAVRNLIVSGANPDKIALIDNFCWPDPLPGQKNPDAEHKLAQLVRTCRALAELVRVYEMPLISGKDSMKNDFIGTVGGREVKISVLPTLLVTALGSHPDVRKIVKPHAKAGNKLYLLGKTSPKYFGATLPKYFNIESALSVPHFNLVQTRKLYQKFYEATRETLIESAHDLSEGGLLVALFETLLLNRVGVNLEQPKSGIEETSFFFSEDPGRILISVAPQNITAFEKLFDATERTFLGDINSSGKINQIEIATLEKKWRTSV